MEYLSLEDILNIHSVIIDETGGGHGVRDQNAVSALEGLPRQEAFGKELYPTLAAKTAVYIRSVLFNHPFMDGNKRTAMACADVFLQLNGYQIVAPQGEVERFTLSTIEKHSSLEDIAHWVEKSIEAA
jgi:death on curing protein